MAKPIKETPTLSGKDAINFVTQTKDEVKASKVVRERIQNNYKSLRQIAKFSS